MRGSPAAFAPLRQVGAFLAEGGVLAVAGIDPGLVRQRPEDALLEVVHEPGEQLGVTPGVAGAAGEEAVAGEQVRGVAVVVAQCERAGRVPAQVDDGQRAAADLDRAAVLDRLGDRQRQCLGVVRVGDQARVSGVDHGGEAVPVVLVAVRRDDARERTGADEPEQPVRLGRGADQDLFAGGRTAEQIGVVVVGADGQLGDRQSGEFSYVGAAADLDVACVAHVSSNRSPAAFSGDGAFSILPRRGTEPPLPGGSARYAAVHARRSAHLPDLRSPVRRTARGLSHLRGRAPVRRLGRSAVDDARRAPGGRAPGEGRRRGPGGHRDRRGAAVGQRALLVRTPSGNVLWDMITYLDDDLVERVRELGGVSAIAISHPHFYGSMVEWAHAFDAPIHIHEADRPWVARPDDSVVFWDGETKEIGEGLTLVNAGVHFAGGQVLHWRDGEDGRGALLSGDIMTVVQDRRNVSFMYSYPTLIPERPRVIRRALRLLEPYPFERVYGAWWQRVVRADGVEAVRRSAERYLERALDDEPR